MRFDILEDTTAVISSPIFFLFFILAVFAGATVYYMVHWSTICKTMVQVLVVKADGHGDFSLAPQEGGSVSLKDPKSDTTRLWPINEMATVSVPYPSSGFVPVFMQKTIQLVIVDEKDWEPLINRDPKREMVASPAVLGNLLHEQITRMVMTLNKEVLDGLSAAIRKLGSLVSPTMFFIGIGIVVIFLAFMAYQIIPAMSGLKEMKEEMDVIRQALGVTVPAIPKP